jgi:hypothetical protein
MKKRSMIFESWEREFWEMNPKRDDLAIVLRAGYVLIEYKGRTPPRVPHWFPTRTVKPPVKP